MDDLSESKHASKTKQKFYINRNPLDHSSDSLSDDIVNVVKTQTKHDVPSTEQPDSKPSKSVVSRLVNWISGGDSNNIKADRPGVPYVKHLFSDKVDIEWDPVTTFCQGDVYQVRIKNIQKKKRTNQTFQTCTGTVVDLEPGTSYIFKVRLIKADGKVCIFGENSETVITMDESKREFAGTNLKHPDIHGPTEQQSGDEPYDGPTKTCSQDSLDEVAQPTIEHNYKEESFDSNSMSSRDDANNDEEITEGMSKKDTNIREDTPGKPTVDTIYTDSVDIVWAGVDSFCEGDVYQVRTENVFQKNKWNDQIFKMNNGKITGLEPGASYVFKVRLVKADGEESRHSDKSEKVTTHTSYASKLIRTLSPDEANRNGPDIFVLPMQENLQARDDTAMTKKYDIGSRTKEDNEKTIMFVGATGTGKSTLVDGLANYLMGVRLSDTFRFTLMQEENKEKQHNQAISQTDWITTYSFNPVPGSRLKYRLNVIDTPGFGDTRGLERDQKIVDQIRHLFEATGETGVQTIDAVCFLIKAPDSRLTATQTYIFNAIMSLFGKDIEGNICTLITFADGSDPPVLHAVYESKLPFGKTFTFNNSALFSNPSNHFTEMFWAMGLHSFESVITHINSLETRSIQLTKEVLQERHCLEVTISNIQFNIKEGLATTERLHSEVKLFQNNQEEINRNAHFTYEVTETKIVKVDLPVGIHVTNCMPCNRTCHEKCVIPDDDQKRRCSAMGPDGYCQQCPNKCFWDLHKNAPFKLDIMTEKVKKTYEDMKKKYEVASGNSMSLEQVIDEMKEELEDITSKVEKMVDNMRTCNNRLKDISLRPNPLGMVEQIDLLIQAEKHERKEGYLGRIEVLQQCRDRAEIGESVKKFQQKAASTTSYLKASVVPEKKKGILSKINWFNMQNK